MKPKYLAYVTLLAPLLSLTSLPAEAATSYQCTGIQDGKAVALNVFEGGYGYDGTFAYFLDGKSIASGYAHGGGFTECTSRTNPCEESTFISYTAENPDLLLTLSLHPGETTAKGSVKFYGQEGSEQAAEVALVCQIGSY